MGNRHSSQLETGQGDAQNVHPISDGYIIKPAVPNNSHLQSNGVTKKGRNESKVNRGSLLARLFKSAHNAHNEHNGHGKMDVDHAALAQTIPPPVRL